MTDQENYPRTRVYRVKGTWNNAPFTVTVSASTMVGALERASGMFQTETATLFEFTSVKDVTE